MASPGKPTTSPPTASAEDDVVTLLTRQHEEIRRLFVELEGTGGDEQQRAWDRLVRLLAIHETAEEEVVHPIARRAFDGADEVIDQRLEEEKQAKVLLGELERMGPQTPQFLPKVQELRKAVLEHADAEEEFEFVQLRAWKEPRQLARMAKAVKAAEATAPTHPYPGVESAKANLSVGPIAAVVDRTRDALRNAMRDND